jgi:hypothetical protein
LIEIPDIPEAYSLLIDQIKTVMVSINADDPYTTMNETDLLLKTLNDDFKLLHGLDELQKRLDNFLLVPANNRILRLNSRIKQELETAIEYYDTDIGQDTRLLFQNDLESDILEVMSDIRSFLALLINTKLNDDILL